MDSLKEIGRQARLIRKYFVLAILFVGIETLFEVLIPLLMSDIIDQGILNKDMRIFATRGIGMIACAVLSLLTGMLYARYAAKASTKLGQLVRDKQFERIQKFTFTNLDHFETSGIITRLTSDVTVVQNAVTSGLRPLARGPVMLVLGLVMSFIINAKLAFVFFIVSPVLALIMVWIVKKWRPSIRSCSTRSI
ncbi:ABC transporter transmembrane domain-containing protein [uncultured Dubosiella sp.]|uniref:ABC transporter transmembrane domain-containing protein n=1 Tax=uncultured Dubosiella sp. TaxID=1937011 RepID=UPI00261E8B42|nr:ABC transporter transmembrane domain-containing protein [uncultured Dubosiella sp.]